MKNKTTRFLLVLLAAALISPLSGQNKANDSILYRNAIQSAMYPEARKVDNNLVPINKQNRKLVWSTIDGEDYILVVTWKQNVSYYQKYIDSTYYNTGNYPIWVTTAPELAERMRKEKTTDINRRLVQLLGLPPNATYSYFVEFWVRPADLFRPCPDKEVSDKRCEICFPANTDAAHINWINSSRIDRYYQCDLYQQYPWTELGYTYDWNPRNKSHIGLSEFVISANSNIKVKAIYTTADYLKK
ncbi:MAG TPA: hypothetical protein VJ602_08000 [Paludibacter sp.]|nr:hypothetical protein [Paludibacter sp.]